MSEQTLECDGGHSWTRESKRGRKPTVCPRYPACMNEGQMTLPAPDETLPIIEHEPENEPVIPVDIPKVNPFLKFKKASDGLPVPTERGVPRQRPGSKPADDGVIAKAATAVRKVHPGFNPACSDLGPYSNPALPGIKISNIKRDENWKWSCELTVNEETFKCVEFGGWTVISHDDNGEVRKHILPPVAAAIEYHVQKLANMNRPPEVERKGKKNEKTEPSSAELDEEAASAASAVAASA